MRLNPKKYVFKVASGKMMGHIASQRGIEVYPDKVKVIQEISMTKTKKRSKGCWESYSL